MPLLPPRTEKLAVAATAPYKKTLLLLSVQLLIVSFCSAQTYSQLHASDTITIHSKTLQAERKVIVTRSGKIKDGDRNNNCILYMDADDRNINGIILQSANNLLANDEIPASYLIGIMQVDRNNELLEKEKLLRFLTEELIPELTGKYHIASQITIAGHSFGAYFATYAFLKNNSLYHSCIAISPAYWPNESDVLHLLDQTRNSIPGNFFLAVGDKRWDEISLRDGVIKAKNILKDQKKIRFIFDDLRGFSHNATPTPGFALGLSFIYDEWEWGN
ncbi:MAG: hypothetical protein EOO01_03525, partial [Chitinophagaceae bacterium]